MIKLTRRDQVRPVEYVECECSHGQEGYFCTVEELKELLTDWDTYRIGQAQNGEYWNKNMSEIFDEFLASKQGGEG